jgi:hypothetical protein
MLPAVDVDVDDRPVDMMGVLQGFENRLEGAVEGFFSRVFRSGLQPVELARGVQRYAADNQHVTADGVVIPNVYRISLSPKDHERLQTFGQSLPRELGQVIASTASERGWVLRGPVKVRIQQEDDIRVGRFRTTGRVEVVEPDAEVRRPSRLTGGSGSSRPAEQRHREAATPAGGTPAAVPSASGQAPRTGAPSSPDATAAEHRAELDRTQVVSGPPKAVLELKIHTGESAGTSIPLRGSRVSVGRLRSCDLALPDSTVSREHAAIVRRGDTWWVVDLGSTNGTRVNGVQAAEQPIDIGDRIEFGDAVVELVEA